MCVTNGITTMNQRITIICLLLQVITLAGWAQTTDDKRSIHLPDSAKNDFEEWLRNEPAKTIVRDSSILQPLPPELLVADPQKLTQQHPPVSINFMTPALRQDMRLAYQSHWLEEQRKEQKGGAMMIGVNPLSFIAWAVHKIFPKRKSKKQRQREKLQQVLDNY